MAEYSASGCGAGIPPSPAAIRIVVAGEKGTGKSSLIVAAATDMFPPNIPPVLPETKLPVEFFPDCVPITIVDTSSRPEDRGKLVEELKQADAVVLTYACDRPETLDRLKEYWLSELRKLEVKGPITVVGCKLDLRDDHNLEQVMSPIMKQFWEIETCIECSAQKLIQAHEVFYYAQKAVLHPTRPLFDEETQSLKPLCERALKRIFILCDHDRDGALSDAELNDFQVKCFGEPLQPSELEGVKKVVHDKVPVGVNDRGVTLTGFLILHAIFIEKGRPETTWTVLRKFGYNNDIRLADELIPYSAFKCAPDQSVELTNVAIEFLRKIYKLVEGYGAMENLFSTAPEIPWNEAPYVDAVRKTPLGGLSVNAFLSLWSMMTLLDPARSVEYLIYIGFPSDPYAAISVTRRRCLDRKKKRSQRKVFQCFVFGPKNAGKSALLNCFLGRTYSNNHGSVNGDRYAVNVVDVPGESGGMRKQFVSLHIVREKKTLVLREIQEDGVRELLSAKESLAVCDVAVFVYDGSDELSYKRARELLLEVAAHGKNTGFEVPCLMVAAKLDLDWSLNTLLESTRFTRNMGIGAPIRIGSKSGYVSNLIEKIVTVAEQPNLSIPKTEAWKSRKLFILSLIIVSVGAVAVILALASYCLRSKKECFDLRILRSAFAALPES